MNLVDEVVMGVLVARLSRPDAAALLEPDVDLDAIRARLTDLRQRRDGLAQLLADGLLTTDAVRVQAEKLTTEIDAQELAQRAVTGSTPLARVVGTTDVVQALERLTLREVRAIISTLMTVRILPAGKGIRFHPNQVAIEWRTV
jgi:hypothetical protein